MASDRHDGAAVHGPLDALLQPANEALFTTKAAPVRLLTLADGASRVVRDGEATKRDELWRGNAYDGADPLAAPIAIYLRICKAVPLVAELVYGTIARHLGLPAPEVFVVLVDKGTLPHSKTADPTVRHLFVGTRDVGGRTFSQLINDKSDYAKQMLAQWKHLLPVTIADEWLANLDRNLGNILFVAQTLHIIDHAESFGGTHRRFLDLGDLTHDALTNKLATFLPKATASARQECLNQAREWIAFAAGPLDIPDLVASTGIARWQSSTDEAELVNFITTRLTITHHLLCSRLGHPQLNLST